MQNRFAYLDILRVLAVVLVMFGHYVLVGGGATSIPGVISDGYPLPLVDQGSWSIWRFEVFLINSFSTQTAILGVTLFFIITGYLMPVMLERYSRLEFLVNRIFRIFPVLLVALGMIGLFVWATQGLVFGWSNYIASFTLSYLVFGVVPVASILWTLVIEVLFYGFSAVIGKFSVYRLFAFQALILGVIVLSVKIPGSYYLMLVASQMKYMMIICVGSAIYLAERDSSWPNRVSMVFGSVVLTYLAFQFYKVGHEDSSTYNNIGTQLLALGLFLGFKFISRFDFMHKLPKPIYWMADLVYPIYLLHAAFGLGTMALVRGFTHDPYVMLLMAITSSVFASWLLHRYVEVPGIAVGKSCVRNLKVTNNS
ncbi:MAG: acyltransferase family protein [Pseudomonas sp.]|uniref:acyltransferase family protein n=1 Tax=Pseudomonas sp. TaxID=306 RepID=UPI003D144EE0